jgi:hypothetical protein
MKYTSQNLDFITYKTGRGISGVVEYYYASTSDIKTNAGLPENLTDWATTPAGTNDKPFNEINKYLWNREMI